MDYERQAGAFSSGRALSDDATAAWRAVAERWLAPLEPAHVLDLGSGTGRFSPLLAEWLGCTVTGVEPSAGMRATALRGSAHPSVEYLAGDGASIPLADGGCDAAWLMHGVHHVPDRPACARELSRVLRPGSRALIIGAYTLARRKMPLFSYFTEALRIVDDFPLAEQIIADFEPAGLRHEATAAVSYVTAPDLRVVAERTRLRADTTLQLISDEEFARGQARLDAAAEAETDPQPIVTAVDLIVFRRD